jgi:hypothetical protein
MNIFAIIFYPKILNDEIFSAPTWSSGRAKTRMMKDWPATGYFPYEVKTGFTSFKLLIKVCRVYLGFGASALEITTKPGIAGLCCCSFSHPAASICGLIIG